MGLANYSIDTAHSSVGFTVRHMVVAKTRGRFTKFSGTFAFDAENPSKSHVEVNIDAASIDTHEPQRDGHLKSPDFLDADNHKALTFKSKRVEGSGSDLKVVGDLTIRGTTHEVTLDVEYAGGGRDPWGNEKVGFSAKTTINRKDYGLVWNQALETGGLLVGEKVEIEIDVEGLKDKAAA
ncbi:MAG: YceI family protein [Polyangiaceae bacterium]|nr:YceI family protein [Polyangiaceae bacterium]